MRKQNFLGVLCMLLLAALPVPSMAAINSAAHAPAQTRAAFTHSVRAFRKLPRPWSPSAIAIALKRADTFWIGHHGPELTAFMDPNCIWCHRFYEKALPLIHAGKLHLRVVLVGFLKPSSAAKAEAVLMAKHPTQAMAFDESHFNVITEEGGIHPAVNAPVSIRRAVHRNTQLLIRTGEEATPTLLYRTRQKQWVIQHGLGPHGLQEIMATIS